MNAMVGESTHRTNNPIAGEIPGILRAAAVGCLIGAVSVFGAVGGALYMSQHDVALALGLGGMSAFWGGLGFGAMLGGTIHVVRNTDDPHSSTKVLASGSSTRPLGIIGGPKASRSHAAAAPTPTELEAPHSSQVA
jgi:hypothetical protein